MLIRNHIRDLIEVWIDSKRNSKEKFANRTIYSKASWDNSIKTSDWEIACYKGEALISGTCCC